MTRALPLSPRRLATAVAALASLVLALAARPACAQTAPVRSDGTDKAPLILVSIDGFRADYLQRGRTPVLSRLAAEGVSAAMRPSFPSVTFPNHYTLVTGLRPDHHGIVDNTMEDAAIPPGRFSLGTAAVTDRRWWDDAEPLWVTAERQGVHTATMFWPGSEADIHGVRPGIWRRYDNAVSADDRVRQVLQWLDLPAAERPRFITLYFDPVDHAGHMGGPGSAAVDTALTQVDAAIGRLLEGLAARGLAGRSNLLIVADHGMADISPERVVWLDDFADLAHVRVVTSGPDAGLVPDDGLSPAALARLLAAQPHARCWRKAELPAELHYGSHRRIPPIYCLAETGWLISTRERGGRIRAGGAHGYRPDAPEMAALFIASGPAFAHGRTLPSFDNVDVYPLAARLLGVKPQPADGHGETFTGVLTGPAR
jgi:predicted AlkP superfamily pyrophosphatase or phosphodiesterase